MASAPGLPLGLTCWPMQPYGHCDSALPMYANLTAMGFTNMAVCQPQNAEQNPDV